LQELISYKEILLPFLQELYNEGTNALELY